MERAWSGADSRRVGWVPGGAESNDGRAGGATGAPLT